MFYLNKLAKLSKDCCYKETKLPILVPDDTSLAFPGYGAFCTFVLYTGLTGLEIYIIPTICYCICYVMYNKVVFFV